MNEYTISFPKAFPAQSSSNVNGSDDCVYLLQQFNSLLCKFKDIDKYTLHVQKRFLPHASTESRSHESNFFVTVVARLPGTDQAKDIWSLKMWASFFSAAGWWRMWSNKNWPTVIYFHHLWIHLMGEITQPYFPHILRQACLFSSSFDNSHFYPLPPSSYGPGHSFIHLTNMLCINYMPNNPIRNWR